jgi:hypothetical protein
MWNRRNIYGIEGKKERMKERKKERKKEGKITKAKMK